MSEKHDCASKEAEDRHGFANELRNMANLVERGYYDGIAIVCVLRDLTIDSGLFRWGYQGVLPCLITGAEILKMKVISMIGAESDASYNAGPRSVPSPSGDGK